jgi:hypothetical protein
MPPANDPKWIKWINCSAKAIIMQDLEFGGILYQRDNISAEEIWEFYKSLPQFEKVVFSQFEARLKVHRKKANESVVRSLREEQYLARDRQLNPRQSHNQRGEPVFDLTPARDLLREDVKNKVHTMKTPSELQASRKEYKPFNPKKFSDKIFQEVRRSKYIYYLELKRAKEQGR